MFRQIVPIIFSFLFLAGVPLQSLSQKTVSKDQPLSFIHIDSTKNTIQTTISGPNLTAQNRNESSVLLDKPGFFNLNTSSTGSSQTTLSVNGAINISITTTNSTCGGYGSIVAVASGGTPPYTYDIGNGATYKSGNFPQVAAGNYKLTVTDALGQSASTNVTVCNTYAKPVLKATSYKAASGCAVADASITLGVTGGTPPYEYSYDGVNFQSSNVFTNLYPGLYWFSVRDANGCIGALNSFNVGYFINFFCDATGFSYVEYACKNEGYIELTGGGPNKPYSYSIDGINYQSSGLFSNLTSGVYLTHFKDATGNIQIVAVAIYQSCYIEIKYISVDAACGQNDGTLTVNAKNGTAPYTYTLDGINYQSSNVFTNLSPGNYNITVRDANGFANSLGARVYDRCPEVTVSTTNETCSKNDGTIKASAVKGTSPYQYSIDGVNFQSSDQFTSLAMGNYTITLKDALGFTSTAKGTINNGCLLVSTNVTNSTCNNKNGSIIVNVTNASPPYQYSIDGVNFQGSNTFTGLAAGNYTITVKDFSGKSGTASAAVSSTSAPTVNISSKASSCLNNDGEIQVSASGGVQPYSYNINGRNFQSVNSFTSLSAGTYTIQVKDASGCTTSTEIKLETSCPVVNATVTDETCGNQNGSIVVSGNSGTSPYQYSIDGINFQNTTQFLSLKSGSYTITIKDALGSTTTTKVVINNICPEVTAKATDGKCITNGGLIECTGSKGTPPYLFSIDGVNFQLSGTFNSLLSGNYTITIKDASGLTNATSAKIENFPSPTITLTTTPASCFNNDGTINVTTNGGISPFSFSIDGINFQNSDVFNSVPEGQYNVIVKDNNGCTATTQATVQLADNLSISPANQLVICEGQSIKLTVASNATGFSWSPANGLSDINSQNPTASPPVSTLYTVKAISGKCSKETSIEVIVNPAPVPYIEKDTSICYGQSVQLYGAGGVQFSWTPSIYLSDATSSKPIVQAPKSSTSYSLKVIDEKGCQSIQSASVKVQVVPVAKVFIGNDTSVIINQPLQLLAQDINNSGFVNYEWSPSAGLNNALIRDPVATINRNTVYTVKATTTNGCEGSGEISIKVFQGPDIYVPSAFTPNGDGLNDVLKPIAIGIKEFKYFAVYNRYGEKVFYSASSRQGGD